MKDKEWIVSSFNESEIDKLSKQLDISRVMSKLLVNRGYIDTEKAQTFLKKDLSAFHSPFLMKDVEKGARLLLESIENKNSILIWGDYDVDGVTSVTVLLKYLSSIGGNCCYYIPKRDDDGYGLNDRVINEFIAKGVKLIITVDSGITAINEIENAKSAGVNVIVTDHHECREILPSADAVINPKRHDCSYPFKELAGVGVVFKFICATEMLRCNCTHIQAVSKLIKNYSEFIAIGTIADVMPICDENRLIVSRGLSSIEKTSNVGLAALTEESGIESSLAKKRKISSTTVGFVIAPRINAAGRMETSKIAVDLFMTDSREEAAMLAARLSEINKERQILENESLVSALEKVHTQCDINNDRVLVLEDENWHHGIIGIVSSRITERYNLPSVLISFKHEIADSDPEIGKGSARSIKGMNLVSSLSSCSDLLQKFGGHELAAGLSIKRSDLPEFRRRINEYAKKAFENVSLEKILNIDCELSCSDLTLSLANELNKLEPYGLSNPVPVFSVHDMKIKSVVAIGEGKHTKLILEKNGYSHVGLMFGTPASAFRFLDGDSVDVAFNLDVNNFRNQQSVQMIIRDIRPSKIERDIIKQHLHVYDSIKNDADYCIRLQDIPTRTDFVQLYTTLKDILSSNSAVSDRFELYVPYLVKLAAKRYSVSIPLYKALVVLDVLLETGLISVEDGTNTLYRHVLCKQSSCPNGKVILENAPSIQMMVSKVKK